MAAIVSETYHELFIDVLDPEAMELCSPEPCSSEPPILTPETCSSRDYIIIDPDEFGTMLLPSPDTSVLQESELHGASQSSDGIEPGMSWQTPEELSALADNFQRLASVGNNGQQWQLYSLDTVQQRPQPAQNGQPGTHQASWPSNDEYAHQADILLPRVSNNTAVPTPSQQPAYQAVPLQDPMLSYAPSQPPMVPQTLGLQVLPYIPMQVIQQHPMIYSPSYGQMITSAWPQQALFPMFSMCPPAFPTYPTLAPQVQAGTQFEPQSIAAQIPGALQACPSQSPVSQLATTHARAADAYRTEYHAYVSPVPTSQASPSSTTPQQANHAAMPSGLGKSKSRRRHTPPKLSKSQTCEVEPSTTPIMSVKARLAERRRHTADCKPLRPKDGSVDLPTEPQQPRKGKRNGRLKPDASANASKMRKTGDCWRCALQRDRCDDEEICRRCQRAALKKGDTFCCIRVKLHALADTFLPDFATSAHQHHAIQNAVNSEVRQYRHQTRFELAMTIGWGKPLRWPVIVFDPETPAGLVQHQYFQDPATRQMMRFPKYSPPLVISKLESDNEHFSRYLDSLYTEDQLHDFSEMCYASESRHETFQEDLLSLLCKLFLSHDDQDQRQKIGRNQISMKALLKRIIRMLILTYIMSHTMTIVEAALPDVLGRVPPPPAGCQQYDLPWAQGRKQISPRLVNRQLKYYFCLLRNAIYSEILGNMHTMLTQSMPKDESWLPVFCCMLGFAMVLEEVQCNIQIQADSRANDENLDIEEAQNGARIACEQIDERYELMVALFQRKYRNKAWVGKGSFTNQTPRLRHTAEVHFLRKLEELVTDRRGHLESRREVKIGHEYQCLYGSRLISRFLLPFLDLPE